MKSNSILNKANSEISKEKTVVGEVAKRLVKSKPTSNSINAFVMSSTSNERQNFNKSNALIKIVDQRNPTNEFDQWIVDRSLKIRQIHEELNNMIAESMEQYLQSHKDTRELDESSRAGEKVQNDTVNHMQIDSKKDTHHDHPQSPKIRTDIPGENLTESDTSIPKNIHGEQQAPASEKDVENEYTEDFEEDVEENPKIVDNSDSQDSFDQSVAAAESVSSSSNTNEDITDEDATALSTGADHLDKKNNGNSKKRDESAKLLLVNGVNDIDEGFNSNQELDKHCLNTNPEKVSAATSPIIFKLPKKKSGTVLIHTSTSVEGLHKQVSTATSPIISITNPLVSTAHSEGSENKAKEDESLKMQLKTNSDMQLIAPPAKLTPKSVDSVLHVSLNRVEEKSPQHTVNLVVHLPYSTRMMEHQTDQTTINLNQTKQDLMESKTLLACQSQESINEDSNKNKKQPLEQNDSDDICMYQPLNKQDIKAIIEPTVSEVLRKIKDIPSSSTAKNNPLTSTGTVVDNVKNSRKMDEFANQCQLVKPDLTLQSRPGYWDPSVLLYNVVGKETAEASNQTQAETQHACVQVARSVLGDVTDKAVSAQTFNDTENTVKSYIERLQDVAPSKGTVLSSYFGSSSEDLSSGSQFTSSSKSSNQLYEVPVVKKDKLSDGELAEEVCHCSRGEICSFCVPKLDLSYGELKIKQKDRRKITIFSHSESNQSSMTAPLSNLPLNFEPRASSMESGLNSLDNNINNTTKTTAYSTSGNGRLIQKNSFSDLASFITKNLRREEASTNLLSGFGDRNPMLENCSFPKYQRSNKTLCKPKKSEISKNSSRVPLVIKSPLKATKVDVVIEDSEDSSYQTSVTSVSLDLCAGITSHSSMGMNTP